MPHHQQRNDPMKNYMAIPQLSCMGEMNTSEVGISTDTTAMFCESCGHIQHVEHHHSDPGALLHPKNIIATTQPHTNPDRQTIKDTKN